MVIKRILLALALFMPSMILCRRLPAEETRENLTPEEWLFFAEQGETEKDREDDEGCPYCYEYKNEEGYY